MVAELQAAAETPQSATPALEGSANELAYSLSSMSLSVDGSRPLLADDNPMAARTRPLTSLSDQLHQQQQSDVSSFSPPHVPSRPSSLIAQTSAASPPKLGSSPLRQLSASSGSSPSGTPTATTSFHPHNDDDNDDDEDSEGEGGVFYFPFRIQLPDNCAATFISTHGRIAYTLTATLLVSYRILFCSQWLLLFLPLPLARCCVHVEI